MPILKAWAPAGTDSHAVSASASASRIRVAVITGSSSAGEGDLGSARCLGRLKSDSDSDRHDDPAGLRRGEPGLECVELLDRAGMVARQAAGNDRAVEAPVRTGC